MLRMKKKHFFLVFKYFPNICEDIRA